MKKKLLLIAPVFFGYYKDIIKEATRLGYDVDYICDTPNNSNFFKAVERVNRQLVRNKVKQYFNKTVLPQIYNKKYDNVLLIGGMTFSFTPEMIERIRLLNTNAIFSLYQWDSEKNLPYVTGIHRFFDKIFTFDRNDVHNKSIYKFLPLFYNPMYEKIGKITVNSFKYDCMYVGTAHPKKFYDINRMSESLKSVYPKQFIYQYMPSKLKYIYHKLSAPEYKAARYSQFETRKLSPNKLKEIIIESKCILDAPQSGQTGLTIRTIECLGAKRKLITTNKDVVNYDFYRPENIYVYDGKIDISNDFFKKDYQDIDDKIYKKYSLKNWLRILLG